jgi:hypothetical protein
MDLKCVQVLRNPLDMAFSKNQNQFKFWGQHLLGEELDVHEPAPIQHLRYWLASNSRAIQTGREKLGKRLFVLNYDWLCSAPEQELSALLNFLQTDTNPENLLRLVAPVSLDRYKSHDLSMFPTDLIEESLHLFEGAHCVHD